MINAFATILAVVYTVAHCVYSWNVM